MVLPHRDVVGEHDCHPCAVIPECIPEIGIVIGEHEMQSVPEVFFAVIPGNRAVFNEFKVNAIPVLDAGIALHRYIPGIPKVNGIA
jgi:hypothetical protein